MILSCNREITRNNNGHVVMDGITEKAKNLIYVQDLNKVREPMMRLSEKSILSRGNNK